MEPDKKQQIRVSRECDVYIHKETGLIFDRTTRAAYARKRDDGSITPLTDNDINICTKMGIRWSDYQNNKNEENKCGDKDISDQQNLVCSNTTIDPLLSITTQLSREEIHTHENEEEEEDEEYDEEDYENYQFYSKKVRENNAYKREILERTHMQKIQLEELKLSHAKQLEEFRTAELVKRGIIMNNKNYIQIVIDGLRIASMISVIWYIFKPSSCMK